MATEFRSIEDAVRGIEKSTYEIQTESRLVYSGLKREQNIAEVLEKYAWLYNPETVRRVEETYRAETNPENKERLRRVYYYLLEGYIGQQTAREEDELVSFEADATVEVDGERIPYHNVPVQIAGEHDFERRTRLRDASLGSSRRPTGSVWPSCARAWRRSRMSSATSTILPQRREEAGRLQSVALAHGELPLADGGDLCGADGPLGGGDDEPEAGRDRQPPPNLHQPLASV